ncbi:MAG: DNA topoisomerase VI subunit B [Deltaproteobacteria bacterium]|nr:DNA topoisomerase VI subunit B [Deltaproteobacteria bacterium]
MGKRKSAALAAKSEKAEEKVMAKGKQHIKSPKRAPVENAESMAKRQREISVSEFFAKNRHLLGFDNPKKALLTTVKEAIDNSLDACEEAGILPEITVKLDRLSPKLKEPEVDAAAKDSGEEKVEKKGAKKGPIPTERFHLTIIDNGPGIVATQIGKIFGKLLYGSKFHRMKMSRGQQGIGISAAGMYGQMTTGKPMRIISKIPKEAKATFVELKIDTKTNKPEVLTEKETSWPHSSKSGTSVEITLEGRYQRGRQSVDEFILQNTLSNPHATFHFVDPDGQKFDYPRKINELPHLPSEIKPHPYGVELGRFHQMAMETSAKNLKKFMATDFSRVSDKVADEIFKQAGVKDMPMSKATHEQLNKIHEAIPKVSIMSPPTDCVVPIGEDLIVDTLKHQTKADFYTATTRSPSVYRGNPFVVECALAYGGELPGDEQMTVYRFANRVPLQFQPTACATNRVLTKMDWKNYGLNQSKNSLPTGPIAILIHVASVWVPFTSESKEAIADYPEIKQEIRLAVLECARQLSLHVSRARRAAEAERKANYIDTYIPFIGEALQEMLKLSDPQREKVVGTLRNTLEKAKLEGN